MGLQLSCPVSSTTMLVAAAKEDEKEGGALETTKDTGDGGSSPKPD